MYSRNILRDVIVTVDRTMYIDDFSRVLHKFYREASDALVKWDYVKDVQVQPWDRKAMRRNPPYTPPAKPLSISNKTRLLFQSRGLMK